MEQSKIKETINYSQIRFFVSIDMTILSEKKYRKHGSIMKNIIGDLISTPTK